MKKRKYLSTVVAVVVLLVLAGVVVAFTMGNVDGVGAVSASPPARALSA